MISYEHLAVRFGIDPGIDGSMDVSLEGVQHETSRGRFLPPDRPMPLEALLDPSEARDLIGQAPRTVPRATPEEVGTDLHRRLLGGGLEGTFESCRARARERRRGLRVGLQFDLRTASHRSLCAFPWELLYAPARRQFLALRRDLSISRNLEAAEGVRPARRVLRLRVLVVSASPSDLPPLDLRAEIEGLRRALGRSLRVRASFLEGATFCELCRRIEEGRYDVVHFMGHGDFGGGGGILCLENEAGRTDRVGARELAEQLIARHEDLRLVVLNACRSGETPSADRRQAVVGAAQALLEGGVPAVVAMQATISDRAAIAFGRSLYRRLAAGDPIDRAVSVGRLEICRVTRRSVEWATPVLYLRTPGDPLFLPLARPRSMLLAVTVVAVLALVILLAVGRGYHREVDPPTSIRWSVAPLVTGPGADERAVRAWARQVRPVLIATLGSLPSHSSIELEALGASGDRGSMATGRWTLESEIGRSEVRITVRPARSDGGGKRPDGFSLELPLRPEDSGPREAGELGRRFAFALLDKAAVTLDPGALKALEHNDEGVLEMAAGHDDRAEVELQKALVLAPGMAVAHSNLGLLRARQGRYEEALGELRTAVRQVPAAALFQFNLARVLEDLGRDQEALESLQRAVRLEPSYAEALNEIGNVFLRLERPAEALQALRSAASADPSLAAVHKNLGRALLDLGELGPAAESLRQALRSSSPEDHLIVLEATYLLAEVKAAGHLREAACAELHRFAELDPARVSPWAAEATSLARVQGCPRVHEHLSGTEE